jgi:hypothetical protein
MLQPKQLARPVTCKKCSRTRGWRGWENAKIQIQSIGTWS